MKTIGKVIGIVPLFGVMLVVYFIALTGIQQFYPNLDAMGSVIYSFTLPSHTTWSPNVGDAIVLLGLFILYIELMKSTSAGDVTIYEHVLSLFVFIAYLLIFLYAPTVANSTFVILGTMSLIDVIAGFTITITAARRDFNVG